MKKTVLAGLMFCGVMWSLGSTNVMAASYVPGTYTASAPGIDSDVTVTVIVDESMITDISVDVSGEVPGLGADIGDVMCNQILEKQSADIDGVSGVTVTSEAIKTALKEALDLATDESSISVTEEIETEEKPIEKDIINVPDQPATENEPTNIVQVAVEENDYSYLEDMTVKELRALREAINRILGDEGGSSSTFGSDFGIVTGSVTYFYNDYKGHVPDGDSTVILIPSHAENIDINTDDLVSMSIQNDYVFGEGVYSAPVNGLGSYTINHVPAGEYLIWIASGSTNTGAWFDSYDRDDKEAIVPYYKAVASEASGLITEEDAYNIAEAIGPNQSHCDSIIVYGGETTVYDYDFGYTYLS